MSSNSLSRSQASSSFGRSDFKPISAGRSSFRIHHYSNGNQVPSMGSSPKARTSPWSSFGNNGFLNEGSWRESHYGEVDTSTEAPAPRRQQRPSVPKSSGLIYHTKAKKKLASIDKINDPSVHGLVCAGKAHLGYYRFSEENHSITCTHDFMTTESSGQQGSFSPIIKKRGRQTKLSTIADVKTGYYSHKNYAAICHNSTVVSVYDLNKTSSLENPLVTTLSEHVRSVNCFEFNSVQTNLLISGGQDACVKVWDLRSSGMNKGSRSDVKISTASDSIRDVKWMPIQNYAHVGSPQDVKNGNNAGFKFASIHDSGMLLLFDLRQPNQVERRINAHTGLGLCLNWHPSCEYIATGGRDGKCCLWYVGDKPQHDTNPHFLQMSSMYTPHALNTTGSNSLAVLPEVTINTGLPVTKLKFCPGSNTNALNASLALSSMNEEAAVTVYSLARKYIPKHVLTTAAPSLGLVWWDDKLIFSVDKDDHITGWNVQQEPTVLDNLSRCTTKWRDIGGNGLLFTDQQKGGYDVEQTPAVLLEDKKNLSHKASISSVTNIKNTSRFMESMKKGMSHTNLPSFSADRSSLLKPGHSFSGKSLGPGSLGLSHHNSSVSSSPFNFASDAPELRNIESPAVVTLDLPLILNSMRLSRIPAQKSKSLYPEASAIVESPVKVFKFLARELEFSYNHAKRQGEAKTYNQEASSNDEEIKEDLMERYGLSENTTWAALVNKKNESDASRNRHISKGTDSKGIDSNAESISKKEDAQNYEKTSELRKKKSALTESINDLTSVVQQKIDLLMELIPICTHNASVYSYIDDLPNFKIWLLVRDSLLWDLKKMSTENPAIPIDDCNTLPIQMQEVSRNASITADDNDLSESACESGATSGINSYVEDLPQALRENYNESFKKKKSSEMVSDLKRQFMAEKVANTENQRHLHHVQDKNSKSWKEIEDATERGDVSNVYDGSDIEDDNDTEPISLGEGDGIPILGKRPHRLSFIDTFMTDVRSPGVPENESYMKSRHALSLSHSSPVSKMSSLHSLNPHSTSTALPKKTAGLMALTGSPDLKKPQLSKSKLSEFGQLLARHRSSDLLQDDFNSKKFKTKSVIPPWNTKKLMKQLYEQAAETGDVLLAVNILLLFQNVYHITTTDIVKSSLAQFTKILHQYELFEISAAILKYSPWDDIMHTEGGQSSIQLFCDKCGTLIMNESSKEKYTLECQKVGNDDPMKRFGYWYCDACKKPNTLCVVCEKPLKNLCMVILDCGHQGHLECLQEWFLQEGMTECPAGCMNNIGI